MSEQPWLRRVEVYVGPLEEWQGGGSKKLSVKFEGDGTTEKLRIRFEIRKSILSIPQPSHIYLYNLGRSARDSLQGGTASLDSLQNKPGAQVELKVGWENTAILTIFSGTLYGVTSERQGPDIVTTLICLAGFGGVSRGTISQTWSGGTKLTSIIRTLAAKLPGVKIGSVDVKEYNLGNQGLSHCGMAKDCLDDLARTYGFSWWIDQNLFYAVDDAKALSGREVVISYKNGTLFRAEPMLVGPYAKQNGVVVHALLNPQVEAGHMIRVESGINPKVNGTWKVHTMTQTGDTHSTEWDMHVDSFWTTP